MGKGVVTSFTSFTPGNSGETVTFNFSEITGKPFRKGNPQKNIPLKKGHLLNWQIKIFLFVIFFNMATFVCFSLSREETLNTTRFGLASFFLLGGGGPGWWHFGTCLFRRKCDAIFAMTSCYARPAKEVECCGDMNALPQKHNKLPRFPNKKNVETIWGGIAHQFYTTWIFCWICASWVFLLKCQEQTVFSGFPIHDESNDKTKKEILCCLTCKWSHWTFLKL